ncbi:MAG: bifunctional hydroxymethylpyrimidine kinase/phosphomethylpyrimidine kinase, partial [Saprospiraceae bacterium]|nr:bifunctional hydroxymethylpyrimidine kinase/phosphomethylpyrimidine kinase [Saprospiraceae bacterium]
TAQNSIVVASGANGKLSIIDDILSAEKIISEADVVLIQLEIPIEVVEFSLRLSKKYGVKTVLNPAPAQSLSEDILSLVDIITPNESETEILTGIYPETEENGKVGCGHLLKKVNESVIITLGHKGFILLQKW